MSDCRNTLMRQLWKLMPLLLSPEGRISRNACLVGGQANIGLQATRLSPLDFEMLFSITVDSEQDSTL
jgi:hypothetical protein